MHYQVCKLDGCQRATTLGAPFCTRHWEIGPLVEKGTHCYDVKKERLASTVDVAAFMQKEEGKRKHKERKKHTRKASLLRDAFMSGDSHHFLKQYVISTLRKRGRAEKVFAKMDKDSSGTIDFDELKSYLSGLCYPLGLYLCTRHAFTGMGYPFTGDECEYLMKCLDDDGDGQITLAEFKVFIREDSERLHSVPTQTDTKADHTGLTPKLGKVLLEPLQPRRLRSSSVPVLASPNKRRREKMLGDDTQKHKRDRRNSNDGNYSSSRTSSSSSTSSGRASSGRASSSRTSSSRRHSIEGNGAGNKTVSSTSAGHRSGRAKENRKSDSKMCYVM